MLAAQERDRGQELTDAYVDERIRAVWQVVTGVADAIKGLAERYAPGQESKESTRHARSVSECPAPLCSTPGAAASLRGAAGQPCLFAPSAFGCL